MLHTWPPHIQSSPKRISSSTIPSPSCADVTLMLYGPPASEGHRPGAVVGDTPWCWACPLVVGVSGCSTTVILSLGAAQPRRAAPCEGPTAEPCNVAPEGVVGQQGSGSEARRVGVWVVAAGVRPAGDRACRCPLPDGVGAFVGCAPALARAGWLLQALALSGVRQFSAGSSRAKL